jgi:hypothetical protein
MHQAMATVLQDVRFHELLLRFDQDLAAAVRAGGCASCQAVLHSARYARKPRGVPEGLGPQYCQCLSLCCARDGCRQRATPPSLRFLGRKVYLGGAGGVDLGDALWTDADADHSTTGARRRQPSHGASVATVVE